MVDQNSPDKSNDSWDKWRNEQVQTISNILSAVFKVEDEVHQMQAPSRLLRGSSKENTEEEALQKLSAIRQQISEFEQMLQMSLKRIDKAFEVIQPSNSSKKTPSRIKGIKKWVRKFIRK